MNSGSQNGTLTERKYRWNSMPITPLHGLAFMFLFFKNKKLIDPLALTASATLIDLEPLYYFLIGDPLDHRIWHGYALTLTLYPLLVTLGVFMIERLFDKRLRSIYISLRFKPFKARYPVLMIYFCSLLGGLSHIFFDMFTHKEMPYVLYPFMNGNPFYIGTASIIVELAVVLLTVYSLSLWIKKNRFNIESTFSTTTKRLNKRIINYGHL